MEPWEAIDIRKGQFCRAVQTVYPRRLREIEQTVVVCGKSHPAEHAFYRCGGLPGTTRTQDDRSAGFRSNGRRVDEEYTALSEP